MNKEEDLFCAFLQAKEQLETVETQLKSISETLNKIEVLSKQLFPDTYKSFLKNKGGKDGYLSL